MFHSDHVFRPQAPRPTTTQPNSRWRPASKYSICPRSISAHTLTRRANRYGPRRAQIEYTPSLTGMHLSIAEHSRRFFPKMLCDSHDAVRLSHTAASEQRHRPHSNSSRCIGKGAQPLPSTPLPPRRSTARPFPWGRGFLFGRALFVTFFCSCPLRHDVEG